MRDVPRTPKGMEQGDEYSNAKATKRKAAICSLFEQVHSSGSTKVSHCYLAGAGYKSDHFYLLYAGYIFTLEVQRPLRNRHRCSAKHSAKPIFFKVGNSDHPTLVTMLVIVFDFQGLYTYLLYFHLFFSGGAGKCFEVYVNVLVLRRTMDSVLWT